MHVWGHLTSRKPNFQPEQPHDRTGFNTPPAPHVRVLRGQAGTVSRKMPHAVHLILLRSFRRIGDIQPCLLITMARSYGTLPQ